MIETEIIFFGQKVTLRCDGKCDKAFGVNNRLLLLLSADEDDTVDLADSEVGTAPSNPGTWEGGEGKPLNKVHNKWCARECERSSMNEDPPDYSKRQYNMHIRQEAADMGMTGIAEHPDIAVVRAAVWVVKSGEMQKLKEVKP